jgi:hypothetical protein
MEGFCEQGNELSDFYKMPGISRQAKLLSTSQNNYFM